MLRIAIVTGSTRPGRNNESVARWVHGLTQHRRDAAFELVDIADYSLPHLAKEADQKSAARERTFGVACHSACYSRTASPSEKGDGGGGNRTPVRKPSAL